MKFTRREATGVLSSLLVTGSVDAGEADAKKVLRIAFPTAETGFDPAQVLDLYSRTITTHIFEGLYRFDHLARPVRLRSMTAQALPEVSADFRTWTFRIRPAIYFSDDPAFKGQRRELTAADYVYSWKRFFDPAVNSPTVSELQEQGLLGLDALRQDALDKKRPFDYDSELEGLRALDRYTLQVRLELARPRFVEVVAQGSLYGAVAREVIEAAGANTSARPVGTGPFVLKLWRRSSFIVLERNPGYREDLYDEQPGADDAEGQAILAALKGRRLPMVDRVEISIIEESQPRWLAFLNRQLDVLTEVPLEYTALAGPNGHIAPNLAKQGIQLRRVVAPDVTMTYFNMEHPLVGGYTPEKVALRRAICLAIDVPKEIATMRRGQAIVAQACIPPHTYGHDPALKMENGDFDPVRAKALLDLYGYVDRNGDGWRERPDGSPLLLEMGGTSDQLSRQFNEIMKASMNAVGLRLNFKIAQWPEQLKATRAGLLMMWNLGITASQPDGQDFFTQLYGPGVGSPNYARFKHAEFDSNFQRMSLLPDGNERLGLFRRGIEIAQAYAPYKYHVHRVTTSLMQPWVVGYRKPVFGSLWFSYVDIDPERWSAPT